MAARVEAKSLSALNFLAANPPQYPVNPTEERRESLVLYISRVPGTRDIILSPFKPQLKNVTAADVTNSLYYVHLDTPSDGLLAAPRPHRDDISPRSSSESARPIHRKPLPPTAKIPRSLCPDDRPGLTPSPMPRVPSHLEAATASAPYGFAGDRRSSDPLYDSLPDQPPRPPPHLTLPSSSSPLSRSSLSPQPPDRPRPDNYGYNSNNAANRHSSPFYIREESPQPPRHPGPQGPSRSPSPAKPRNRRNSTIPFCLTLIRRDPASGHQWNVGKVSSFQSSSADDTAPRRPDIDVHIDNSGYAKFRGMPTKDSIGAFWSGGSSTSLPLSRSGPRPSFGDDAASFGGDRQAAAAAEGGFTRQVAMTYSKSWATNLKHALGGRRDRPRPHSMPNGGGGGDPYPFPAGGDDAQATAAWLGGLSPPKPLSMRGSSHTRNGSTGSAVSLDSFASSDREYYGSESPPPPPLHPPHSLLQPPSTIGQPGSGLRPRGYAFTSPWDGRCAFRTSNGGRSLRCKHILNRGAAFGAPDGEPPDPRPVSELRFNLPSRDLFRPSMSLPDENGHLSDQFAKLLQVDPEAAGDDELDAPMDLSLGREKAGGGNRGKRAKLGKLIIHDEGLKMLDLVVAANMGVWWVAWEKAF